MKLVIGLVLIFVLGCARCPQYMILPKDDSQIYQRGFNDGYETAQKEKNRHRHN